MIHQATIHEKKRLDFENKERARMKSKIMKAYVYLFHDICNEKRTLQCGS